MVIGFPGKHLADRQPIIRLPDRVGKWHSGAEQKLHRQTHQSVDQRRILDHAPQRPPLPKQHALQHMNNLIKKRNMSMTNDNSDNEKAELHAQVNVPDNISELPEPVKKRSKLKPSLIWLIPLIALLLPLIYLEDELTTISAPCFKTCIR